MELLTNINQDVSTLDCSIIPTRHKGFFQVSTIDFFFPLVNDPYHMGKIAAANVISDIYAVGVTEITTTLMVLSSSRKLTHIENDVCMSLIMKGFTDVCHEAGTSLTGGQTVKNEEIICGGVAISVCKEDEFVAPDAAEEGDVLILTKEIGTQLCANFHQWYDKTKRKVGKDEKYYNLIKDVLTDKEIIEMFDHAKFLMYSTNRVAAKLMKKYDAHCATDITGFGLIGHTQNLCTNQKKEVDFVLENIPCIKGTIKATKEIGDGIFKLFKGLSAETSGGLLIALPKKNANSFLEEFEKMEGKKAYVIGKVVKGSRKAKLSENVKFFAVEKGKKE